MFKKGSRLRRRPSASMIVATVALFVALSGGAYAAVVIPNNSIGWKQIKSDQVGFRILANNGVGTAKIQNNAVTYQKIAKGQIGHARVAQNQIQWRVNGKCAGAYAIQSVTDTGSVTCAQSLPADYNTAGLSEPLTSATSGTVLASQSLPTGSAYMVTATPYIQVKGTAGTQNVTATCELVSGTTTETRSATFALGTNHEQQAASIPLTVDMPAATSAQQAAVACVTSYDGTVAPTVQASSSMDALQLSGITTSTTPGTSTTAFTLTAPTPGTITTTTGTTTAPAG